MHDLAAFLSPHSPLIGGMVLLIVVDLILSDSPHPAVALAGFAGWGAAFIAVAVGQLAVFGVKARRSERADLMYAG